MLKLFLTLSLLMSSELLQASWLQRMRSGMDNFRSLVARETSRAVALGAVREMVGVELNAAGMAMLDEIDIGLVIDAKEIEAEVLAELLVCEYNMRTTALLQGEQARDEAKLLAKLREQELVSLTAQVEDTQSLGDNSNCKGIVCLGTHGWKRRMLTLGAMQEHGSDMTFEEVGLRFRQRWWLAKKSFKEVSEALSQVPLRQAQLDKITQSDLQVDWDIYSRIIVPQLGHTLSPGLVVLAQVYEFAARVFALEGKEDLVKFSLASILKMKKVPDDNIIMTVSTSEDSYPMRLDERSLEEVTELYMQQVN